MSVNFLINHSGILYNSIVRVKCKKEVIWYMFDLPEVMTVQEVAKYLRLKRSTAYELVKQGVIPSIKLGRQIRVPKSGLKKMLGI